MSAHDPLNSTPRVASSPGAGLESAPPTGEASSGSDARGAAAVGVVSTDDKTVISKRPRPDAPPPLREPAGGPLGEAFVGRRLEHYELTEFVGGGGMGAVYRATDTRLGRTVAVKVLSRDHSDEETIRRFQNEAQSAARLDHPNIARVFYVGEDHGWNFIVFEFIEGVNLRDMVLASGPLPLEHALRYTLQVAEALDHSSSRDVVHRDIKPSNVLVTAAGQVKLVDMGLARLHQVETSSDDLTASGVTLGTFDYISPEQARDPRAADVRSDIYSLGCTLFYMLTGQPPFPDGTAVQKLLRHSSDPPPDVRAFRPELAAPVSSLLAKMLAKRPAQRPQTAAELVGDLVALAQQLGLEDQLQPVTVVVPNRTAAEGAARLWQAIAAVALLAVGILLLDSFLSSRHQGLRLPVTAMVPEPIQGGLDSVAGAGLNEPQAVPAAAARAAAPSLPPISPSPLNGLQEPAAAPLVSPDIAAAESGSSLPRAGSAALEEFAALAPLVIEGSIQVEPVEAEISASLPGELHVPAAASAPKRIVVAQQPPALDESDSEFVGTLEEACRRAAALGLAEIELRWNGPVLEKPLEITSTRLAIRAAAGFRPTVVFRPDVAQRQMIRLAGGGATRFSLHGLELRLELPAEPASGWALIAMSTGQALEATDAVLTIEDGDGQRPPLHDEVAFVRLEPRRASDLMASMDPQLAMGQSASIQLERTLVRGEATLVAMNDETPLSFRWSQGLLATSRRLIETGGSAGSPKWYEKIDLDLDSVTLSCRQGLYQMRRGPGKTSQFAVSLLAKRCIITTEAETPLFEYIGPTSLSEEDLRSLGDFNRYAHPDVIFLRLRSGLPGEAAQDFVLDRCQWSNENHSRVGIPWLRPLPRGVPAHALTKSDFLMDPTLAVEAGFDPAQLPDAAPRAAPAAEPAAAPSPPVSRLPRS